jgi:hypothetical protein
LDPYLNDPERWGVSMAQHEELMLPCLDAAGARSVAEVGAFAGDLTRLLLDWADRSGARVQAIDPAPQDGLVELDREHEGLELVRETSLDALKHVELPDAVVIDGDHNHYTVTRELRLIAERVGHGSWPLVLFHDVAWPHARRDDYFDPTQIPAESRHEILPDGNGLFPGDPGSRPGGLPYPKSAAREGGAGNGVLTAVEDFAAEHPELQLAVIPAFFGFGALWPREAPYAAEVERILAAWDRNSYLERLEANRVHHMAEAYVRRSELWREQELRSRQEKVLRRLLDSSAFALAERLSRLRVRAGVAPAQGAVTKDEIRQALDD